MGSTEAEEARPGGPGRGHVPGLDGLRGVAILLVLMVHLVCLAKGQPTTRLDFFVLYASCSGWCGVTLFFVLSGFLITGILADGKSSPHRLRNFYARRALRIFPLYYGALALWLLVLPRVPGDPTGLGACPWPRALWYWLYAANWGQLAEGFDAIKIGHFWSLAVEEHFYLLWPFVVWGCRRGTAMRVCVAGILVATVSRAALALGGLAPNAVWALDTSHLDALGLGSLLALGARGPGGLGALVRPARCVAAVSAAMLAGVVAWLGWMGHMDPRFQAFGVPPLVAFFGSGLVLVANAPGSSPLGACFGWGPLRFFGTYSYGVYVWHGLLMPHFEGWFPTPAIQAAVGSYALAAPLHGALAAGASLAVAVASYHLYEAPFLRLKARFTDGNAVPTPFLLRARGPGAPADAGVRRGDGPEA